jgi:hypothetical protein
MFFVIGKLGQHNIGKSKDRHAHAGPQHAEAMSAKCACVGDSRPLQNLVQAPKLMNMGYKPCTGCAEAVQKPSTGCAETNVAEAHLAYETIATRAIQRA